jgi:hypothetical protein
MKRPDINFTIIVNPVVHVYGCRERQSQETRGYYGFHDSERCPNCRTIDTGFEFWGENGHCQGSAPNRERMVHWIAIKAKQQWRTQGGQLMGYRFVKGGTLRYCGGYLGESEEESGA